MTGTADDTYELLAATSHTSAASACAARGGELADYMSDIQSAFVDLLCDADMMCWVAKKAAPRAASAGACPAVHEAELVMVPCINSINFVCHKAAK